MNKKSVLLLFCLALSLPGFSQITIKRAKDAGAKIGNVLSNGSNPLSSEEVGKGLKEALEVGVGEAVDFLSAKDGYLKSPYKILVPEEAQKVTSKLKNVPGFGNVEADLTERMNRAAELAAQKAKPIFVKAITSMSFQDAFSILKGEDNAATAYLKNATYTSLYNEFKPIIRQSLDEVNATEYWHNAVTAYNKLPFVTKTNPELDDHVTGMALVGMFSLVEKKEKGIRTDVSQRSSDLLKKVFSNQD